MSIKGLPNIGLSCYINSVLQVFYHIEEFQNFILNTEFENKESFIFYFHRVFELLSGTDSESDKEKLETIFYVFKSFCEKFEECKQGDATQFVSYVLNKLHSELTLNSTQTNLARHFESRSIISDLFRGEQEDRIICEFCDDTESRLTKQNFYTLPLMVDLYKNMPIDNLLMKMFAISSIPGFNCDSCNRDQSYKQTIVVKWPRFLIITICRGVSNNHGDIVKVNNEVIVKDHKLIVADNSHLYDRNHQGADKDIEYNLQATINHRGDAHSGHYTCLSNTAFSWLEFNDLRVRPIENSQVVSRDNNLLIFSKVDPMPISVSDE